MQSLHLKNSQCKDYTLGIFNARIALLGFRITERATWYVSGASVSRGSRWPAPVTPRISLCSHFLPVNFVAASTGFQHLFSALRDVARLVFTLFAFHLWTGRVFWDSSMFTFKKLAPLVKHTQGLLVMPWSHFLLSQVPQLTLIFLCSCVLVLLVLSI